MPKPSPKIDADRNAGVGSVSIFQVPITSSATWSDLPAGLTDPDGVQITTVDFRYSQIMKFQTCVNIIGAGGLVGVQYSLDGTTWLPLTVNKISTAALGVVTTDWEFVPAAVRGSVATVAVVASGGNGLSSPKILGPVLVMAS